VTAWEIAAGVADPELPMVTLADLGILRAVEERESSVTVTITPTYSGCPAMREISRDLESRLHQAGYADVQIRTSITPAWSSDWITPVGREKLSEAGVAPPNPAPVRTGPVPLVLSRPPRDVTCPQCHAAGAALSAEFSSTACKALYRCTACGEPFEYVKEV